MPGSLLRRIHHPAWFFAVAVGAFVLAACRKESNSRPAPVLQAKPVAREDLQLFQPEPVGEPLVGNPWVTHVMTVDLDADGLLDTVVCEGRENTVLWLRQTSPGVFAESVLAADMRAPVHAEPSDIDGDGDTDLLVACMSVIFPNNDQIGAVTILENQGGARFKRHVILDGVARVSDVRAADLNGDGKLDLAVGQFGYDQGEVRWMERIGPWEFRSHILLNLSGTVNLVCGDFNGDRHVDIAALVTQQWEEIHLFENDGRGTFRSRVIWGSTNEDYAGSGMVACDLNRDGREDLLFTNGDGFGPAALPGPRPWHGVQWLENVGGGSFRFRRIGDLPGAYSPVCSDLDGDGDHDVIAISAFNEWEKPKAVSMVWYENTGAMNFTPRVLAYAPTHLLSVVAADFDRDGRTELFSGGFHAYPPFDRMSRLLYWKRKQ